MKPARLLKAFALLALGVNALWWVLALAKPLRNDQIIFESAALGILQHGYPRIDYGLGFVNLGLWHPPLLFYLQAAWTWLTGSHEVGARLPGVLGVLLALGLLLRALRQAGLDQEAWALLFLAAASVTITTPALIPDHDGALVLPAMAGLTALLLKSLRRAAPVPLWPAVAWVCLGLWGKLTTPILLYGAWVLAWLGLRGVRAALREAVLPVVLGTLAFGLGYLAYSAAFGLNPIYTPEYMLWAKIGSSPWSHRWESLIDGAWVLGPAFWMAGAILGMQREDLAPWRRQGIVLCLVMAALPWLTYSFMTAYNDLHPFAWKYLLPSRLLVAVALALAWDRRLWDAAWERSLARLAAALGASALLGLWVLSPRLEYRAWASALLLAGAALVAARLGRDRFRPALMAAAAVVLLAETGVHAGRYLTQSADSPPEFGTGEKGYHQVTQALRAAEFQGATFLCRKDVGFYTPGRRAIPIDPHFRLDPRVPIEIPLSQRPWAQRLAAVWPFKVNDWTIYASYERAYVNAPDPIRDWLDKDVDWVIDSRHDPFLRDEALRKLVLDRFSLDRSIGDYDFYRRKSPRGA